MSPFVVLAILAVSSSSLSTALPYASLGMYGKAMPGLGMHGSMHHSGMAEVEEEAPLRLACYAKFFDGQGKVANELAVNIEDRSSDMSHPMHGMMGMTGMTGMTGMYGYGVGSHHMGTKNNLRARVELISNGSGGTGYVVFTERSRIKDGCQDASFGSILTAGHGDHAAGHKLGLGLGAVSPYGYAGYGYGGGYGGYGYYGGYTAGYGMGVGMGVGIGHHGKGSMSQEEDDGVVAEISITPGALTTAIVDDIGFEKLSDLAGRGVAICSEVSFDMDWNPTCAEPYFSCCSLRYDNVAASVLTNNRK